MSRQDWAGAATDYRAARSLCASEGLHAEEAGVLLAHDADGGTVVDGHPALAARTGVHAGDVDLLELCAEHGLTPAIEQLAWVAHWITPKGEGARRFDTRFYLAPAPAGQHSVHDDNETIASMWVSPTDALARAQAGELMMMPPTVANLRFIADFATVDAIYGRRFAAGTHPARATVQAAALPKGARVEIDVVAVG